MKAAFNRKSLLEAFASVSTIVPSRSPKPILMNVKMSIDADDCTLTGTDLEVGIRRRVMGSHSDADGDVILPAARFGSILKTSSDDEIVVETSADGLLVRAGRSKFKLPLEDPALYPVVPDFDAESYAVLLDSDLRMLIRRTSYACDLEASARYALGGALMEAGGGELTFVATDGRRLAKASIPAEYVGDVKWTPNTIIPLKALKLINNATPGDGAQVHLGVKTGTAVVVRTEDSVVYSRLLEGRLPAYSQVFPPSPAFKVPINVARLRMAVDQASILTSEESRGVTFGFGADVLRLTTSAADVGSADVQMPYNTSIDGLDVSPVMDPRYVGDVLRAADQESDVVVELVDAGSAVVLRSGDRCMNVIMPITKQ